MSLVTDTFSNFGPLISDIVANYATIWSSQRSIGGIVPDCTIEEHHIDELVMTLQPVEQSAPITDHCYMMPFALEIRAGFSNSSAASEGWVQAAYQQLQALQQARQLFDVSTGKRYYTSMLMRRLTVTTNADWEYALNFTAVCQQVLLTNTQTSNFPQNTNGTSEIANSSTSITANDAQASGLSTDSNGNVSWPNAPAGYGPQALSSPATLPVLSSGLVSAGQFAGP